MCLSVSVCTSVWGVSLRQDEVLEVNDADGLGPEPAVGHHPDVVLGGQGLKDGDGEHYVLRLSCYHLWGGTHTHKGTEQEHKSIIMLFVRNMILTSTEVQDKKANLFLLQEEVLGVIDVIIDGILHP